MPGEDNKEHDAEMCPVCNPCIRDDHAYEIGSKYPDLLNDVAEGKVANLKDGPDGEPESLSELGDADLVDRRSRSDGSVITHTYEITSIGRNVMWRLDALEYHSDDTKSI